MAAQIPTLPAIEVINGCTDVSVLADTLYLLFEPIPDLLNPLFTKKPFTDYVELIAKCRQIADNISDEDTKVRILDAHPRLGGIAPKDAKEDEDYTILKDELSVLSKAEQQSHIVNEKVDRMLAFLNRKYEDKFGFKFVEFVNGRSRSELIPVFQQRINNTKEQELNTGLKAMFDIALSRLNKLKVENKSQL